MVEGVDEPWSLTDATDTLLNQVTIGQGTSFPSTWLVDRLFWRTDTNILYKNTGTEGTPTFSIVSGIDEEETIFGDGSDGNATNPTLSGGDIKQYDDLTISSNVTWAGTGTIVIRVKGTFNLQSGDTITVNTLGDKGTDGGKGGNLAGDGGDGAQNRATIIILADTVTGTGTIQSTGLDGGDGTDGSSGTFEDIQGEDSSDNNKTMAFGIRFDGPTGGKGGKDVGSPGAPAGDGGESYDVTNLSKVIDFILGHFENSGGSGGGGGDETSTSQQISNGGGGAGGNNGITKGGNGEVGELHTSTPNATGGGGGGGGSAALIIIITRTITGITINLTGGDGGEGGIGTVGLVRTGGGGGSAACVIIAAVDNVNDNLTAGQGDSVADDGETRKVFGTFDDFSTIVNRKI